MTIDEAIKILTALYRLHQNCLVPLEEDAIKLGIEALKRESSYREYELRDKWYPLPGETK